MSGISFSAKAYDSAVLLRWFAGAGEPESTPDDICEVTIQFSSSEIPSVIPNTPPYVVRELQQPQMTNNLYYHAGLANGTTYVYTLFVHYMDTGYWEGPVISAPVIPTLGISAPFISGSLSHSKLSVNTRLQSDRDSMVETVIWLPDDQADRKAEIEAVVNQLKPAHVRTQIVYEPYYVAQTTAVHFAAGTFASGSYEIVDSTLINKIPTIDYSFSGAPEILGGS